MSEFITGVTFGGTVWTPSYVTDLNQPHLHRLRQMLQGLSARRV